MRASASRQVAVGEQHALRAGIVLSRRATATDAVVARSARATTTSAAALHRASLAAASRRLAALEASALALAAHDPQRTLERGYALVSGPGDEPVTSADEARTLEEMTVRFHDGTLRVRP
jgi:exodeoxyribonuclease VII large subunit